MPRQPVDKPEKSRRSSAEVDRMEITAGSMVRGVWLATRIYDA